MNFNSCLNNNSQHLVHQKDTNNCNNCSVLLSEQNELKKMLTKIELDVDIERQANRDHFKKLNLEKTDLKKQLCFLKKKLYESEAQVKKM